jgi:hypothetical protein
VGERRKALLGAVTPEDVAAVARKLVELSLAGDVAAAKVLLSYVIGRPTPAVDVDRLDLSELAILKASPPIHPGLPGTLVDPGYAIEMSKQTLIRDGLGYLEAVAREVAASQKREAAAERRLAELGRHEGFDRDDEDDEDDGDLDGGDERLTRPARPGRT